MNPSPRSVPASFRLLAPAMTVLLVAAAFPCARGAPEDPERFLFVEKWEGNLKLSAVGSGEFQLEGGPSVITLEYELDRSLDMSFVLEHTGEVNPFLGYWTDCVGGTSMAVVHDYLKSENDGGCITEHFTDAAGPLVGPQGLCPHATLEIKNFGGPMESSLTYLDLVDGSVRFLTSGNTFVCGDPQDETTPWQAGILLNSVINPDCKFPIGCIDFPEEGLEIHQTWDFDAAANVLGFIQPQAHYVFTLDLLPLTEELELVVTSAEYPTWIPEGGKSEEDGVHPLRLQARLQKKGGGAPEKKKAVSFRFELTHVSREPGVSLNFPLYGSPPDSKPDLAFLPGEHPAPWLPFPEPSLSVETEYNDAGSIESPQAVLHSFDWGAFGTLRVTAELTDGRTLVGHFETEPEPHRDDVLVPKREDGSFIADEWKRLNNAASLADNDDSESTPEGDKHKGDGLTLYEEYRGFHEGRGNKHVHGNPEMKELFIHINAPHASGIKLFKTITGFEVHDELTRTQLPQSRVINVNHGSGTPHRVDQHGLVIEMSSLPAGVGGIAKGGPGLPRHVQKITLTDADLSGSSIILGADARTVTRRDALVAHEMLHASNVYHHGQGDWPKSKWVAVKSGEELVFVEWSAEAVMGPQGFTLEYTEPTGVVRVLQEDCTPVVPGQEGEVRNVYLAVQQAQHSGIGQCVMRYAAANAYMDKSQADVRWLLTGKEPPGTTLCTGNEGTRMGQGSCQSGPRHGDATGGCCKQQLCINDDTGHVPATGPPGCSAGGGGAADDAGDDAGVGAGAPAALDPTLSLTADERRETVVYRGWPVLVVLEVLPPHLHDPARADERFVVAGAGTPWTDSVEVSARKATGESVAWPFRRITSGGNRLVLDGQTVGVVALWISPEDSAALAAGEFEIDATLDTRGSVEGWNGVVEAEPVTLTVLDEPVPLTPELEAWKLLSLARYRLSGGETEAALALVDQALEALPGSLGALAFKAEILALEDRDEEALAAYDEALEEFHDQYPLAEEPPFELLEGRHDLLVKVLLGEPAAPAFRRGDTNGDGRLDLSDAVAALGFLFLGSPQKLPCDSAADADDSGKLAITDAIYLLSYLFTGGTAPPPPFGACGVDATLDGLPCEVFAPCGG